MKDDKFILEYIFFKEKNKQFSFNLLSWMSLKHPLPSLFLLCTLTLILSLSLPHTHAHSRMHSPHLHTVAHAHNQQTAFISLYLKENTCKRNTSAYGAHFCTSGLMLLSSLFVLSIIVLKGKNKAGQCPHAAVS